MTPALAISLAVLVVAVAATGLLIRRAQRQGTRTPEQLESARKVLAVAGVAAIVLVFVAIFMPHGAAR
jgi:hypothetical protein